MLDDFGVHPLEDLGGAGPAAKMRTKPTFQVALKITSTPPMAALVMPTMAALVKPTMASLENLKMLAGPMTLTIATTAFRMTAATMTDAALLVVNCQTDTQGSIPPPHWIPVGAATSHLDMALDCNSRPESSSLTPPC